MCRRTILGPARAYYIRELVVVCELVERDGPCFAHASAMSLQICLRLVSLMLGHYRTKWWTPLSLQGLYRHNSTKRTVSFLFGFSILVDVSVRFSSEFQEREPFLSLRVRFRSAYCSWTGVWHPRARMLPTCEWHVLRKLLKFFLRSTCVNSRFKLRRSWSE